MTPATVKRLTHCIIASSIFSVSISPAQASAAEQQDQMVLVPGGTFIQGSAGDEPGHLNHEGPAHEIVLEAFYLSRFEVTVGQFRAFVEVTGYKTEAERNVPIGENSAQGCFSHQDPGKSSAGWVAEHSWRDPGFAQEDEHPVVCVSWNDANAFAEWLSGETGQRYRLPSESEFEYALRAGSQEFASLPPGTNTCEYANQGDQRLRGVFPQWEAERKDCDDGYAFTSPAGSYHKNTFGLNDMEGNVSEWTSDCWHRSYDNAPSNGASWQAPDCRNHVLRGGDFMGSPAQFRSAHRSWVPGAFRTYHAGFRVARDL